MKRPFSTRRARKRDAAAIAQLSGTLGYDVAPDLMVRRLSAVLLSKRDLVVVAVGSAGIVIGWAQAHMATALESGFRVEILGLVVAPGHRRLGVGRALVEAAERWARTLPAEAVVVRSEVRRAESHLFYPTLRYVAKKTQTVYRKPLDDARER